MENTISLSKIIKKLTAIHALVLAFNAAIFIELSKAQIVTDSTLGNEQSQVTNNININGNSSSLISGGAIRGFNLFHSFERFNVSQGQGVYFENPTGIDNIIGRVTVIDPSNTSKIMGVLGVRNANGILGKANLFLINPNGIIFGPNSSLDLGGSFIATTAHAIQFQNQGSFDVLDPNSPPLLNVNPSGFLFSRRNIASITNSSQQASGRNSYLNPLNPSNPTQTDILNGLRVPDNRSLILLGGSITMAGGGLYSLGGRVEIVSIAGSGLVELFFDKNNLSLNVPSNIARDNISFSQATNGQTAKIYTTGNNSGGGNVQIIGKNIQIKGGSQIISATTGKSNGGIILLDATDEITLSDFARNGVISTITYNSGSAGNINIFSKRLVIDKNAQINSSSRSDGKGGNITVNSSDLINITGVNGSRIGTGIFSPTLAGGSGGNISIETLGDLILSGSNAGVFSGGVAGIIRGGTPTSIPSPVGAGGNIRVIAANSVQLDGGSLGANNFNGKAGNIDINTNFLNIYNGFIQVNSVFQQAGNIKINANSLDLKNGSILANTGIDGANINLTILDTLKLSNESLISANASKNANGGNITIDTSILLAIPPTGPNGSDIRANADFGKGGNIVINSQGVFGTAQRKARDGNQTNDIDASSQFGQSGQVQINTTTDPSQGIVELPATVVDPTTLVAQNPCRQASSSEFTRSGRGGLPPSLSQDLSGESTQVGLVEPANLSAAKPEAPPTSTQVSLLPLSSSQIAPAKGWVYNDKGEVVLVAYNSAVTGPQRLQSDSKGCPVF